MMKALIYDDKLLIKEIPKPERQKNQSLIKVILAGICNTDLEILKGYMAFKGVLGHEFVGIVEESDSPSLIGKRVIGEINVACKVCDYCRKGLQRHCPTRSVIGIAGHQGAFAEYIVLPDDNIHIIDDAIANNEAVFTEPLAAALEILEQIKIEPDHKVCIIGDGKLALLIVQVLLLTGADILMIGKHTKNLTFAEQLARVFINIHKRLTSNMILWSKHPAALMDLIRH